MAGLIRNPEGYDPFVVPETAKERLHLVVDRLVTVGQIAEKEAEAIAGMDIPTKPRNQALLPKPKDYFVEEVTRLVLADPRLGKTQAERYDALFRGGLTIRTTLDRHLQGLAEKAVASTLPDTGGQFSAALVSVQPGTGTVRALVGGPGFEHAEYNIAAQGVGPAAGVVVQAVRPGHRAGGGISAQASIDGRGPCSFPNPGGAPDPYRAENFEGSAGGRRLHRPGHSPVDQLHLRPPEAGHRPRRGRRHRRQDGHHHPPLDPVLSLPLGSKEVLPLDMAEAYATFAADGMRFSPYYLDEVVDAEGKVILRGRADGPSRRRPPPRPPR